MRRFLDRARVVLVVGKANAIDLAGRRVMLESDGRSQAVVYDTLVYAAGSIADLNGVPGIAEQAHALAGPDAAARLRAHAQEVAGHRGSFVVVGGGLTGIEVATEMAESYPAISVMLASHQPPGGWLSPKARRYLGRAFDRLGLRVRSDVRVEEVKDGRLVLAGDGTLPFDGCVWAGGFGVPDLARAAGLAVTAGGRVLVDRTLRSLSHPDVYAIGDAAAVGGPWGEGLSMGCRSGGFTGPYVADALADRLAGRTPKPFTFRYFHECISLGRNDGVIQFLRGDERPHNAILTGRAAARYKEIVLSSTSTLFRMPGPYLPRRRRLSAPAATISHRATATAGQSRQR